MRTWSRQHLISIVFTTALIGAGAAACGDDDSSGNGTDAGTAGKGGSAGKSGSGGNAGKAGAAGHAGTGGTSGKGGAAGGDEDAGVGNADVSSKAADLRVTLDLLLSEHLGLAAKATAAALGDNRGDEFNAYHGLLDANGNNIGDALGKIIGNDGKTTFNTLWQKHDDLFVQYTTAVKNNDTSAKTAAETSLSTDYVEPFSDFIASGTGLDKDAVKGLLTAHVNGTAAIVDAQAAKNWDLAYSSFREAFAHMQMIGDALSEAIISQKSADFPGDPKAKSVDFRVALNELLQEHVFLASFTTSAALRGANGEVTSASNTLTDNGHDLGSAVGNIYGDDAKTTWNNLWDKHNGYFVDYTKAVAAKNDADKKTAVDNLTNNYVNPFSDFLAGATGLASDDIKALLNAHVTTTAKIVDDQGANKPADAANDDLAAEQHMATIGNALAPAIVNAKPGKF
jgi:hypothetical protein